MTSRSFAWSWRAVTVRTVPERERITSDSVVALPRLVAHALQELAVGDAGGGEEDVVAGDEAVDVEDLVEVVAGVDRGLALVVVARPEPAEQLAAEALDRGGGDHALGRAADSPEQVDAGVARRPRTAPPRRRRR